MAVTEEDVRHMAALARVGVESDRIPQLVVELNGILAHMDELSQVNVERAEAVAGVGSGGMPLRPDEGPPLPLDRPLDTFAPDLRDGFFLVPRLDTHEDLEGADLEVDA